MGSFVLQVILVDGWIVEKINPVGQTQPNKTKT